MTLNLKILSEEQWKQRRNTPLQKSKWINSHWITSFNKLILPLSKKYNGIFIYDRVKQLPGNERGLTTCETSPVFQLFSLHSNTFTHVHLDTVKFQQLDCWKSCSIDDNIIRRFNNFNLNKYEPGSNKCVEYDNYVLLLLQSKLDYFNLRSFAEIIKWSKDNKRTLVIKLHPYTDQDNYIFPILRKMKEANLLDYVKVVTHKYDIDTLIDKSDKVWVFNSGVALNAILKGKSVATLLNCEYNPLASRCNSPYEADTIQPVTDEVLYRYLSWFYHRYTIDIGSDTANDRFIELFDHFYKDKKSLECYMNTDWK